MKFLKSLLSVFLFTIFSFESISQEVFFSVNQIGFLPEDRKVAVIFSEGPIKGYVILQQKKDDSEVMKIKPKALESGKWGDYHYYELDFSGIQKEGDYFLSHNSTYSEQFNIGTSAYLGLQENLLEFMRQQRCGYNPTLDMVCHQKDGRSFFGPMPDSTYVDVSGGWHDAGDQLKHLITGSYATGHTDGFSNVSLSF